MKFNKQAFTYILSVGLAFYAGMKLKQLKRLHTFKVGKLVVEFQDNRCGFKTPSIIKPKSITKPLPTIIKVPPKTDIEKVLEPEKVKKKEPKLDNYEKEVKIDKCYEDFSDKESELGYWDYAKEFAKCKKQELYLANCSYISEGEWKDACHKQMNKETDEQADEVRREYFGYTKEKWQQEETKEEEKQKLKNTFKEALEEVSHGNSN